MTVTPSDSSRRSSWDRLSSRPWAMRPAVASVGLVSPRSTWESIGAETPLRSVRSRSERPIASRSARMRGPICSWSWAGAVIAMCACTLSRTAVCRDVAGDLEPSRAPAVRQPRGVLLEEQSRHQLAAARDVDLLEDRLEVILDRPRREEELVTDLLGRVAPGDQLRHVPLALGQAVRVGDQ